MDWWILELMTTALLVAMRALARAVHQAVRQSYAADVFRANPRTGKSFIVLTDIAYYLIFFAYILFTVSFEPKRGGPRRSTRGTPSTRRPGWAASC